MQNKGKKRSPQQNRSRETRDKIVEAGITLFAQHGFYKTTSRQIARKAGVSVGSFYAYFSDKKELFKFIIKNYLRRNRDIIQTIDIHQYISKGDHKGFISYIINKILEAYKIYPDLHQEIEFMVQSDEEIKKILKKTKDGSFDLSQKMLLAWGDSVKLKDIEAASVVIQKAVEAIVYFTMFNDTGIDSKRVIDELAEMFHSYIFKAQ